MSSITDTLEKSEIKNVDAAVLSYIVPRLLPLVNKIALFEAVVFFMIAFFGTFSPAWIGFLMVLPVIGGISSYILVMREAQHIFMKQIAKDLNFTYSEVGDVTAFTQIFSTSNIYEIDDMLVGTYDGLPTRIFNCMLKMSQGDIHANVNTIFEIELDSHVPTIAILGRNNHQTIFKNLQNLREIQMEGDFSKNFNVWIENDTQLEAYEILTPDVMKEIEDLSNPINILFISNKLYIFTSRLITSKSEFITTDHLISRFLTEWLPIIKDSNVMEK